MNLKKIIGIIGGRSLNTNNDAIKLAFEVGRELAKRDLAVVCGGEDGIMEAVCKGCLQEDGITIGILKWNHVQKINPYIKYAIPTSMDLARNNIIVWASSGLIAFDGGFGTLSEIALCLDVEKPLIVTGYPKYMDNKLINVPSCRFIEGYNYKKIEDMIDILLDLIDRYSYKISKRKSNEKGYSDN